MPRLSRDGSDIVLFDLKAAREARNLTQIAIADILCTSQASVARWEKSGAMPKCERKLWEYHWIIHKDDAPAAAVVPAVITKPVKRKIKPVDVKATHTAKYEAKKAKGQLTWQKNLRKRRRGLKLVVSNEPEPERDDTDGVETND
jgi:transcriptional regulator with XRE-family HTH domain